MKERLNLVAACGIDCGICELYLSRDNQEIKNHLISVGIPEKILPCDGCNNIDGKCPILPTKCATYECAKEKGVTFCSECEEFPCMYFAPTLDKANTPHNVKVFNLCTIKKEGVENFVQKSSKIKQLYYKGKMVIGKGPELEKAD